MILHRECSDTKATRSPVVYAAVISGLLLALCSTAAAAQRAIVRVKDATTVTAANGAAHAVAAGTLLEQRSRDANGATVIVNAGLQGRLPSTATVTVVTQLDNLGRPITGFAPLPPITPPGTDPPVNPWKRTLEEYAAANPATAPALNAMLQKYQISVDVKEVQQRLQLERLQLQQLQKRSELP